MSSTISNQILSEFTTYTKYAKYIPSLNRRETWEEIAYRNMEMHIEKFPNLAEEIKEVYQNYVFTKKVLPSMRSMQFAGQPIKISPNRIYNCSFVAMDDTATFSEIMFLLLGGSGVGFSVQNHHIEKLPEIRKPNRLKTKRFLIGDSIEGWADAIKYLMKSYFRGGYSIEFDYSDIRPKGARLVTSGGKAPGPEPLKMCIENIKGILDSKEDDSSLSSTEVHDIVCYIADAVLAGGIRRAALISLFDADDVSMLKCKSDFEVKEWKHIVTEKVNTVTGEKEYINSVNVDMNTGKKYYDIETTYIDPFYGEKKATAWWVTEDNLEKLKTDNVLPWYYYQPQRGRANNSVTLLRDRLTEEFFFSVWKIIKESNAGEPGFFLTNDKNIGTNPCAEISLLNCGFCNLTEVNVSDLESQEDLNLRVKAAAFIGTLQASYTNFHYLRPIWRKNAEKEALLGIGLTGIGSGVYKNYDFKEAARITMEENERMASVLGINKARRVNCIKPSGTTSCVLGTSSGVHAWHNDYYIRRIRLNKNEAVYTYLSIYHPELLEDDVFSPATTSIIKIPIEAPKNSILRSESPIETLERVKFFHKNWVQPGHRKGANTHNVSCTISIKEDEWEKVGQWMWKNRKYYSGISVLPYDAGTYVQAPFTDITEQEYNDIIENLKAVDLSKVIETDDNTDLSGELACVGGACEIK